MRSFGIKELLAKLASVHEEHIFGFFLALVLLLFALIAWDYFRQLAAAPWRSRSFPSFRRAGWAGRALGARAPRAASSSLDCGASPPIRVTIPRAAICRPEDRLSFIGIRGLRPSLSFLRACARAGACRRVIGEPTSAVSEPAAPGPSRPCPSFVCADLAITPEVREDHASYIASWLKVLKDDKRAVFAAAAFAQKAADYLSGLQKPESRQAA